MRQAQTIGRRQNALRSFAAGLSRYCPCERIAKASLPALCPAGPEGPAKARPYFLLFFLVDFFAVFFLAVFFAAAISWLLRVRRLLNPSVASFRTPLSGRCVVSKVRRVRVENLRRFVLLALTASPQRVHSTNFTNVSSRRTGKLEANLQSAPIGDRITNIESTRRLPRPLAGL